MRQLLRWQHFATDLLLNKLWKTRGLGCTAEGLGGVLGEFVVGVAGTAEFIDAGGQAAVAPVGPRHMTNFNSRRTSKTGVLAGS